MTAMSIERLAEIRERAVLQWRLGGPDAYALVKHVDHLTAELATAHTAWDEWKESSRAGHTHASDMTVEAARLRAGIEELRDRCFMEGSWAHAKAAALLDPPTERIPR